MGNVTPLPDGVTLTPLKIIANVNGDIFHALKASEDSFKSFGEAYFSSVSYGKTKGWKRHTKMILNLIVPMGEIKFVLFDDRQHVVKPAFHEVTLSRKNYHRLTVPPGVWVAFHGSGKEENILLNIASIQHDPQESENLPLVNDYIKYNWI